MDDREVAFLTRFVEESDAIERISNAPGSIARQLAEAGNSRRVGHAGALLRLHGYAQRRVLLSARIIKEVQRLITEEQPLKGERVLPVQERGHWRKSGVFVGGRAGSHWKRVPKEMVALINDVRAWQQKSRVRRLRKIQAIAGFHWRYERIHPFTDGNGRSGRALVYYLYRWVGLRPFVFTHEDRYETYYPCFNEEDSNRMRAYFIERTATL